MRFILTGLIIIAANTHAQTINIFDHDSWRCVGADGRANYTNIKEEMAGKNCKQIGWEQPALRYENSETFRAKVDRFRKSLKIGDQTTLGLVVETKPPIFKIQPKAGVERWFRSEEIFPATTR